MAHDKDRWFFVWWGGGHFRNSWVLRCSWGLNLKNTPNPYMYEGSPWKTRPVYILAVRKPLLYMNCAGIGDTCIYVYIYIYIWIKKNLNKHTKTVRYKLCGHDRMVVRFTTTYAMATYHHWSCEFESFSSEMYRIQHYVMKFVSDFRQPSANN